MPVSYTHLDVYKRQDGKRYIIRGRNKYNNFLGDFPGHKNYDRDVLVVCDEPEKENSVNQLSEFFETIWNQEDSGYSVSYTHLDVYKRQIYVRWFAYL